ncbi:RING finger and transmembrane domain-containing protein 2-like isoform X2 [Ornithodoros turicata]
MNSGGSPGAVGEGADSTSQNTLRRVLGWTTVAQSYGRGRALNLTNPQALRNDLHQVIMGLSPLLERSAPRHPTLPSWSGQQRVATASAADGDAQPRGVPVPLTESSEADNFVINMEDNPPAPLPSTESLRTAEGTQTAPSRPATGSDPPGDGEDRWANNPELRALIVLLDKYLSFVLIFLVKLAIDHRVGILVFLGLFVTFCHANSVIKREVGKQGKRQLSSLLIVATNLITGICFVYFILAGRSTASALIFMFPYTEPIGAMDVLWVVIVTDFVLKLITVLLKAAVIALPPCVMAFPRRGKIYLFIETSSQVYRTALPMQHWLFYFSEAYSGAAKVCSILLSGAYLICKCTDIVAKAKAWRRALIQTLSTVRYGRGATEDQIKAVGGSCPICQDDFKNATMLTCGHIFCEECVSVWFDRERTCPMCRAQIADDPTWRDGSTSLLVQVF